ncbi:hypothetical protein AA983_04765 [Dermacoccus sp. PE3]|nr:hypothetical protein AA983_04765 [Dermacoccus sp. PE3]
MSEDAQRIVDDGAVRQCDVVVEHPERIVGGGRERHCAHGRFGDEFAVAITRVHLGGREARRPARQVLDTRAKA